MRLGETLRFRPVASAFAEWIGWRVQIFEKAGRYAAAKV